MTAVYRKPTHLTCICIGTAITTLLQNTVSLTPLDTGQQTVCTSKQLLEKEVSAVTHLG